MTPETERELGTQTETLSDQANAKDIFPITWGEVGDRAFRIIMSRCTWKEGAQKTTRTNG